MSCDVPRVMAPSAGSTKTDRLPGIEFDNVTITFPDGTVALKGLDLTIDDGEFVVLVGPSGCGKSTALRSLAGLEPVSGGAIRIKGCDVTDLDPQRRDVAMVFQSYALYPHKSIYENLAYPLRVRKAPTAEIDRVVRQTADLLALSPYLQRKPKALSGGQRQRVAMGRALVRKPSVFLMDEPLSNLDAALRVEMRTEILMLHRRLGVSTVYVTHDQVEALTMGDRVAVMRAGVLEQFAAPKLLYEQPRNIFVASFVGSPAINLAFVEMQPDSAALVVAGQSIPFAIRGQTETPQLRAVLGIRPEAFAYSRDAEHDVPLKVLPSFVEFLGSEVQVHFTLSRAGLDTHASRALTPGEDGGQAKVDGVTVGKPMVARLGAHGVAAAGRELELWISSRSIQLFDAQSGLNLA
jgi:multiple sugar transport system ATP-binding protein